jgi:hypothetical protein
MPVATSEERLAASPGDDVKRAIARRAVAQAFFKKHVFEPEKDWDLVIRALQCIDYAQPVFVGPMPAAPKRLVGAARSPLGAGFFAEQPPKGAKVEWWHISPEAPYLKWYAPYVIDDGGQKSGAGGKAGEARYFVPAARSSKGARLAIPERP